MSDKKVKISNILGSQIPDFIQADNPLFIEFLTQYYESEEREYGSTYLSDHISSLKKISTVADISLVEKQTVPAPNSTNPESPVVLASLTYAYDDVINVNQTTGFPDKYGLLKIDNEIITYTGKTATSFTGCIRGFSGISALETAGSPEFLTFSDTNAAVHNVNTLVVNLSFLFVTQFYKKFKKHFLPGLEGKSFAYGLNVENILSRARDFYSSKGTDTSLQILFQVLYGEQVDVIKPFNQTFLPSDAEWDVTDDIIVESLSGNPINLIGLKIYQDSFTSPTASGAVANVQEIYLKDKKYHKISFSKGTITNKFKVSTKTKVVGTASTTEVTTVDSTIGFNKSGNFYYLNADNRYTLASYTSKSNNQFFGCTGISTTFVESDPIIDTNFIYGYENNDLTKICTMRVTGSISGVSDVTSTKYFDVDDKIRVKHLGKKTDINDKKFNTWFYNNLSYVDVLNHDGSESFTTRVDHFLKKGDRIDVILKSSGEVKAANVEVKDANEPDKFSIEVTVAPQIIGDYVIRKRVTFIDNRFGITSLMGNIQNSFVDSDGNTYVSFSGYPSFETDITNRSKTFNSAVGVSTNAHTITVGGHNFTNGEQVYLELGKDTNSGSGLVGISTGYYFVNVVDSNTIKLASTQANLFNKLLEQPRFIGINTSIFQNVIHTITPADLHKRIKLRNQSNFKRIYKNPVISTNNQKLLGSIGVSLNGIEYQSPISRDYISYGQLDEIEVLNSGENYDIVNPPTLSITDTSGSGCDAYGNFSGNVSEIIINNRGFDFAKVPSVTISGGNGSGAVCEAKMRGFYHKSSFTDFDVNLAADTFNGEHKFLNGEEVTYVATGTPIGIGSTNVGFTTNKLLSGSSYFISKRSNTSFALNINRNDAIAGINTIYLVGNGDGTHTFRAKRIRQSIDRIVVTNSGSSYSNRKVQISSQKYPPTDRKDIFKTIVGVNTFNDYIYAKNHNFKNGDNVEYVCTGTTISGLSTSKLYKVTIIDANKFKLSDSGTSSSIVSTNYDRKIYESLNSVGVGTHTFKYPDVRVNISNDVAIGLTSTIPEYYKASAYPIVRGKLEDIFLKNGGVGYGVTNIINFVRQPSISFLTGKNAVLTPIIIDGRIVNVIIPNEGSEYTTPPDIEVVGVGTVTGSFAKLKAIVSDGKITNVQIIEEGSGYIPSKTLIKINPVGKDALVSAKIYKWEINSVERYKISLTNNNQLLQINSESAQKGNKICSFYPPTKYRELVNDNNNTTGHSKIVGWAYDGNPIYGAITNSTVGTGFTFAESSYSISAINDNNYRPLQTTYPNGYFTNDYIYGESGDLDEFNGKFTITPEYPNGTYAYFSTVDKASFEPTFPYITFKHRNHTDDFNYNYLNDQSDLIINDGKYKRNVTHLGLNETHRKYPLLQDTLDSKPVVEVDGVKSAEITEVTVDEPGENYKVNDKLNFSDPTISSRVSEVLGKPIVSVGTTNTIVNNLKFSVSSDKITGLSTIPHGLLDRDVVQISGISSTKYKNLEGIRIIGVSTVTSSISTSLPTSNTGISTFLTFSDSTTSRKFKVNDIVKIGTEQLLIIDHDDVNNKHRVIRGHNSNTSTTPAHNSGSVITRLEKELTYTIDKKLENKNIDFPKIQYFEAAKSVGIGTSFTNVTVGFVGVTPIKKSIPPKAIFLPNHKFKSGDEVSLVSLGSTIFGSKNINLSNPFNLSSFSKLFCVKINDDFVGLSTEKVGFSTNNVFFKQIVTGLTDNAKLELILNNVTGDAKRVNGTVTVATATSTGQQHGLSVGDEFKLDITSNQPQSFDFRYNENIRKLVVNPISFTSSGIQTGTNLSKITINNHDFETGDIVVYNSSTPATPLVDDGVYHVIKDSSNTIRLANNSYDLSTFPYNYIGIGTTGGANHQIAKINPKLIFYKGRNVSIATSDSSLTDYDIEFYKDSNFISKYDTNLITRSGVNGDGNVSTKISVSVGSSLADNFYYRIMGKSGNYIKTLSHFANEDVPNHSEIEVLESKFNINHKVTGIGTNIFRFNPVGVAETALYSPSVVSSGFSSAFYSTKSTTELGGIHSVEILNKGFEVSSLPILTSIGTTTGSNAVLTIETDEIGKIEGTQTIIQGIEFPPSKDLQPEAESNLILDLKNVFTLKSIGVTTGGVEYTTAPNVIVIGNSTIVAQSKLNGSAVESVDILTNDTGLSEDIRIVPINNSNGVVVKGAETASGGLVTLELRAPIPETGSSASGFYNQGNDFPFKKGDEIFVENVKILNDVNGLPTGDGYNSSDYNYNYFTVVGVDTTGGAEKIQYSISGIGSTGGTYQVDNNFGRAIKKDNLATFNAEFSKVSFFDNEIVKVLGKGVSGVVASKGWDSESETLKLFNVIGEFVDNDIIVGSQSNNKSTVEKTFKFDFDLNVDSSAEIENGWKQETGKLNSSIQNLHDNDYYQRFSYSIKGAVPYNTWKDSVNSLDHVAGFKNFCNLGVHSTAKHALKSDALLEFDVDIDAEASVHEKFYYDLVSENTTDPNLSKLVTFDSKIITDYNESITNKVLMIDDISSQFTGIVTSTGGGVIGTTSFDLFTNSDSLFHRGFNPSSGVSTATHTISIQRHEFNTGEQLIYKPQAGQSAIGIAATTVPGIGVTNLLPPTIFAIKEDNDLIKVAVAKSFADAGISVSFVNVSGIGTNHTLSVPSKDATIRTLISVDNIIQSPVGITTVISVGLSTQVGVSTNSIFLNDISDIEGKSLLRIESEILKVNLVGVGSTNSLSVERGQMGTVAAAHTVGAAVTVMKGDYRINEGRLYFTEAPYGPTGGISTFSSFTGRAYYRLSYDTNKILDDISDRFDGSTDKFNLTSNGVDATGITSSFGAVLINNIFQKPFLGVVGSSALSDYTLVGTGQTIDFTGTNGNEDLPRGGIINEFDVGIGSGYQFPRKAIFSAVVSNSGTVQSVGIVTGGAGYLSNPLVSISSTIGVGAAFTAFVSAGVVTSITINNAGAGYTNTGISTGLNFITVAPPSPYKNIPLTGGNGSGASIDVVVGTGGSIISFDMSNRGIGYEIGDNLQLSTIPFQVGIGTSAFNITVKNKYQDKFAGWCFGQLLELDDFSSQFNGFRKSFLITRTITSKEYYSIVAQKGSGIILQNNLLIFINDILQIPGKDYTFSGGTRISFREAPKRNSKFRMYFYAGSESDFDEIDVEETIKPGDQLRLQKYGGEFEQDNRVVYELIAADTLETQTYSGVGISTDTTFLRPTMWRKQTEDLTIDGLRISKERNYLEPKILPTSGIIKSVSSSDTKVYIKDSWAFSVVDGVEAKLNNVSIVGNLAGIGTTAPKVEEIKNVTYVGDYGDIVGIGTSAVGINTTGPALFFELKPDSTIFPANISSPTSKERLKTGITTGDYFVIQNTSIGSSTSGVTGIKTTSSGPEIVGVGTEFVDNVYFAEHIVSVGSSIVRVFSNVQSISGINTVGFATFGLSRVGNYSWGAVNVSRGVNSKSFEFFNQNGISGIETSAQVIRSLPVKITY